MAADGAVLTGRITAVMPIGPSLIYQVALGDGVSVKIVQDRADALPAGAQDGAVYLSIKANRASGIFPDTVH